MNEPININEASFERAVIQSPIPVVVDFWAPWCGPCKMIAPLLDEIAKENGDRFRVAKVNIDDDPALQQRFGIRGVPTLLFFSGGEPRDAPVRRGGRSQPPKKTGPPLGGRRVVLRRGHLPESDCTAGENKCFFMREKREFPPENFCREFSKSNSSQGGEIGRRARLRIWWSNP